MPQRDEDKTARKNNDPSNEWPQAVADLAGSWSDLDIIKENGDHTQDTKRDKL